MRFVAILVCVMSLTLVVTVIFVRLFHAVLFAQACALLDDSTGSLIVTANEIRDGGGSDPNRARSIVPRRYPITGISLWQIEPDSSIDDGRSVHRRIFDDTHLWLKVSSGTTGSRRGTTDELTDPVARVLSNFPFKQQRLREQLERLRNHALRWF